MSESRATWIVGAALLALARSAAAAPAIDISPANPSPGEVFVVHVEGVRSTGPLETVFLGHTFALWPTRDQGWEGLVAVDRDESPGIRELVIRDESDDSATASLPTEVRVEPRRYAEQRLTVNERMVSLAPKDQRRATKEARRIHSALAVRTPTRLWDTPFSIPVDGPISSAYGVRRYYNGKRRGYHGGVDLAATRGTVVHAAAAGKVVLAGNFFYTGWSVFIDHGFGLVTAYFHMESIRVTQGQGVGAADALGRVGSTGRSTGPHLHWAAYLDGLKVDPLSLTRATGGAAGGGETP